MPFVTFQTDKGPHFIWTENQQLQQCTQFTKKCGADKRIHFSYFLTKTYVVGAQKNCLIEIVLLSTHDIFWLRKIHFN